MKIIIHANQIEWQGRYARHAIAGLKRHGINATVTSAPNRQPCDIAILMGPNAWQLVERADKPFIMFNRKFVGNDPRVVHENCAISWNGFNGYGTFCVNEVDPTRLERYMKKEELLPWHKGTNIIYGEQSNVGRSRTFKQLSEYYSYVKKYSGGTAKFRKKPIGEENISYEGVKNSLLKNDPLVYVNLNSTISLDCLAAGIPVISLDAGDPTWPITSHDIQTITYTERLSWFQHLAMCQWTETEITNGDFWDKIYPMRGPRLCDTITTPS